MGATGVAEAASDVDLVCRGARFSVVRRRSGRLTPTRCWWIDSGWTCQSPGRLRRPRVLVALSSGRSSTGSPK